MQRVKPAKDTKKATAFPNGSLVEIPAVTVVGIAVAVILATAQAKSAATKKRITRSWNSWRSASKKPRRNVKKKKSSMSARLLCQSYLSSSHKANEIVPSIKRHLKKELINLFPRKPIFLANNNRSSLVASYQANKSSYKQYHPCCICIPQSINRSSSSSRPSDLHVRLHK